MMTLDFDKVDALADKYGMPASFVRAIIEVESSGNPCAIRIEPGYQWLWNVAEGKPFRRMTAAMANTMNPPLDFPHNIGSRATEWLGQKISWGPMQVMGAVARELGFTGFFPELCSIVGVEYGVKHLASAYRRCYDQHGLPGVAAAYNAGSAVMVDDRFVNQAYVDKVFSASKRYERG